MRTSHVVAKLRCPSPTKYRATVSPQQSLLFNDETHDGIRNGVFLNERCEPTQDPSRTLSTAVSIQPEISDRYCRRLLERYRGHRPLSLVNHRRDPITSYLMRYSQPHSSRPEHPY